MTTILRPTRFSLIGVSILDVGALRGLNYIGLTNAGGAPTNIFLIMGPNGAGKTTILEAIYGAMKLLDQKAVSDFQNEALDRGKGGVQLDARVVLDDGIRSKPYLLSIVLGEPGLLRQAKPEELERLEVEEQITLHYRARPGHGVDRTPSSSPIAVQFAEALIERAGDPPRSLFETSNGYPTVLYFPSDRGIRRPPQTERAITTPKGLGYAPAHRFDVDGDTWAGSLDNLFVWFTWLADGRDELCRELVNTLVFRNSKQLGKVNRQTLAVPVVVDGEEHRLDQLSSGERQLVQLVVRVASHMTGSTIVLIDETEQHLHLVMRRRLLNIIKDWARPEDGPSFIMTSHQVESMRLLAPKLEEEGLVKGGCLVKAKFKLPA